MSGWNLVDSQPQRERLYRQSLSAETAGEQLIGIDSGNIGFTNTDKLERVLQRAGKFSGGKVLNRDSRAGRLCRELAG
jgi:hypothetical protein